MRNLIILLVLGRGSSAFSQPPPQPDLQFVVVENAHGRPMRGTLAESFMEVDLRKKAGQPTWIMHEYFTISDTYPYGPEKPGDLKSWTLHGEPIRLGLRTHLRVALIDCYCRDVSVHVIRDSEVMRIDLPATPAERWALLQLMQRRSAEHASPEVFRFRPGRFTYAELANDPTFDRLEARLAARRNDDPDQPYRDGLWRKQMKVLEGYFASAPITPAAFH
jgi:hypothetical protein